jgi:hypothetical protein
LSEATKSGSTNLPVKKRWRSQKKKFQTVADHILSCLESGGKTFNQLYEGLAGLGISDHPRGDAKGYLSDVLRDLLLWERSIEQREERVYTLAKKQKEKVN